MLTDKRVFALGLAAALIILLFPVAVRISSYSGLPMGETAYYYAKAAAAPETPYALLLSLFGPAQILAPAVLGILSFILFFFVLKQLNIAGRARNIALFMLLLAPAFIYAFTFLNPQSLSISLLLLSACMILSSRLYIKILAALPLALAVALSFFDALLAIFLLCAYFFAVRRDKLFFVILPVLFTESLLCYLPNASRITLQLHNIAATSIADLGAIAGFSSFLLLLGFIGFLSSWRKKSLAYTTIFYLVLAQLFFGSAANPYVMFILAVLAAQGFCWILARDWELKIIRNLTVMLLVLGMVFSAAYYVTSISNMKPGKETASSLEWLAAQEKGIVLSHHSNGFWIEYFADMPAFVNTFSSKEKISISNEIFYSRNLERTRELLSRNNITYIWIDQDMRSGEVWSKAEQGLLFLFRDNETFKRVNSMNTTDIWQVVR